MKPIHARWLVGLNDYLRNKPDVTRKVFKMAEKVEAVTKGLEPEDPFVWGKTSLGILRRNFDIFAKKMTYLNAVLSFLLSSCYSARSEAFA